MLDRRSSAALLAAALVLPVAAGAQETASPALLNLRGELVSVRYAPGSLDRAARLQRPYEAMAKEFAEWTKRPTPIAVYLLERDDWARAELRMPYGLPARMAPSVLAQASWGDERSVELWRRLLGAELPVPVETTMRGSPAEAASLVPGDLLGLVEAARVLLETAGLGADQAWATEIVAHSLAVRTLSRLDRARLALADRFYALCLRAGGPEPRPLADYRTGLDIGDWLWFQARFHTGARRLLDAKGDKAAKKLVQRARKHRRLDSIEMLERYRALDEWHRESFR